MNEQVSEHHLDFTWDDVFWTTSARLLSWGDTPVNIVFAPEGRGDEPLAPQEIALIRWVITHDASMAKALFAAVLKKYPMLQENYGYSSEERVKYMPDVETIEQLGQLIDLQSANVHQITKAKQPYAGFEFACRWDQEHGLGVLMHGNRVVQIGGADTAILLWIAEADAEKP